MILVRSHSHLLLGLLMSFLYAHPIPIKYCTKSLPILNETFQKTHAAVPIPLGMQLKLYSYHTFLLMATNEVLTSFVIDKKYLKA